MCLAIPGEVLSIDNDDAEMPSAKVSFGGIRKDVCLAYTPEVQVGDYVLVHVGFAISRIDADEAQQVFEYLEQMGSMEELSETGEEQQQADEVPE